MKEIIYFDYNIFVNYLEDDDKKVFDYLNNEKENYTFVYSPAYLEEVANITGDSERINHYIDGISQLFNDQEFLPTIDKGIILYKEKPRDCYKRVINGIVLTDFAEKLNNSFLNQKNYFDKLKMEMDIRTVEINNIEPESIFMDSRIREFVESTSQLGDLYYVDHIEKLKIWNVIKNNHNKIQDYISYLFDILEVVGYHPEKSKDAVKKFRSRMHDVSHAIYGSQADYFVIEDKKFRIKCKAVYSFLGISTQILSYLEFKDVNKE